MENLLFLDPEHVIPNRIGETKNWQRLHGSAASLVATEIGETRPLIYICSEVSHMRHVKREVSFYRDQATACLTFPDWECLPYDRVSPHPDLISKRLLAMSQISDWKQGILIVPITSLMQRTAPLEYIHRYSFVLKVGDEIQIDSFRDKLQNAGYYSVSQVMSPGEYAIRGGIVDVFPAGAAEPFRLDLFDTTIEAIKLFDAETQRSSKQLNEIRLLPAKEVTLNDESIKTFRQAFRATIDGDPKKSVAYRDISNGLFPSGCEFYLPLFYEKTASVFDFLPENALIMLEEGVMENAESLEMEISERFENAKLNEEWPPLPPRDLYLSVEQIYQYLAHYQRIQLVGLNLKNKKHLIEFKSDRPTKFNLNPRSENPYSELIHHLNRTKNRILLVAESAGRRESLLEILRDNRIDCSVVKDWPHFRNSNAQIALTVAEVDRGLALNNADIEIITESEIYGERNISHRRRSEKNRDPDAIIRSLAELQIGDPIVHEDHGVGRYRGLESLSINGLDNEFATIEYMGGDKVYIPVLSLDLVSRYIGGGPESAPLHKMGNDSWAKLKNKAKEKAYDVAAELLDIQAMRKARKGYAFPEIDPSYDAFAAGFPFEETADQLQVINDVILDMTTEKPMDRLVCGDVGFGKTEIALRAAFIATTASKQVVMLVPTTLLAQQHYDNFCDRFADWPIKLALFSRFNTAKENEQNLESLKNGTIDIAIGTHKLIQKSVHFKDLGLMIIDEEHRFGVRQKEQLKKLRSQVDILTLTATPIPRTLNFALSGLRDISVIATPPKARLSVKTFVREWDDALIREAIVREIRRGGQVYFLHNEVQTINKMQSRLQDLVPDARIRIGHGQLSERELELIMRDFNHQRFNILLCTTIIESGIDVPSANTILINRADRFGMAQLHQLRGRVGRSHHQAFAYMLTPSYNNMTADAKKRLQAIESLDTLGAGFALASQDLEIRGAGELLGESQSGMIDHIGYSMYSTFLEQAIATIKHKRERKAGETLDTSSTKPNIESLNSIEINLNIPARFPDAFIPDVPLRLTMYKRIASAVDQEHLKELQIETIDRFGLFPEAAKNLFSIAELKLNAKKLDIKSIEFGPKGGVVEFLANPNIDIQNLLQLVASNARVYKFAGPEKIQIAYESKNDTERVMFVRDFLEQLSSPKH